MDQNNPETLKDPGGEPGLTADWNNSESVCPEKEQRRCLVTEDVTTNGSWSQSSISRSLQRAETLLRTTFNPSLKWLFHGRSQDEDAEEGHFVVAHNLVSRSSARLLRLQQALLTVAPQWQLVGGAQVGSPQVCVKGVPEREAEGGVVLVPSSSLQGPYRTLWRLLEQRSLLLFIHEYTRRARLAAAYISRVSHLLEEQLRRPHLTPHQTLSSLSSFRVSLGSLSQELRVHLNHWSCLFSKVQSDHYLRPALVQQTGLLVEIKQTLDSLGLQALVLMEHYVCVILSAVARAELDSVPREVLQDILAGTDVYNQAVEEQRAQRSATQLRTAVLLRAHHTTLDPGLPHSKQHHPAAFSVRELTVILAAHHAETAAEQLRSRASAQSCQVCQVHHTQEAGTSSVRSSISCGTCTLRPEWTWEQLQHTFLIPPPLLSSHQPALQLHRDSAENHLPVLAKPTSVQHRPDCSDKDPTSQCQTHIPRNSPVQASVETVALAQPHVENCEPPQTISPPSESSHRLSAPPVSAVCQQERSSVELLFQLLVSCSDLLVPLVSHTEAPAEPLLPHTPTDVTVTAPIISAADSVELNRLSTDLSKDQNTEGSQADWAELDMTTRLETTCSSGFQRDRDPEGEVTVGLEGTAVAPDCVRPHSVQWLDLGQSLVFADLLGQYRALLWTLCSRALWLQMFVPPAGSAAGSINLQDNHRGFQILDRLSRASETEDLVPKECRAMLEDFRLNLLVCTAHAQWDYVLCRGLGSALKDKCLRDGSHSVMSSSKMMSVTMEHFLLLTPPLLSSLCCQLSDSRSSGSSSLLTLHRQSVSLVSATVQLSTFWILSKAYQFLSSWSLNRFLLITQGDLKELRESLEVMVRQTRSLMMNPDSDCYSSLLLRQQLEALDRAVSELQTFSSLVLKTFSSDCKRMSGEIFEQTMPSSVHWKHSHRTGFPSSPSEYASLAAQTVIGQVLEGVAPLSDDARVQALSVTMTAFLEAWMEHILKQKIKFSVQGALQLKQDFDSIRELIQSDRYGLSADLHQHLLSLRVFQQVDSAVVCLLQQPQAKPYLQSRTWEPFTRCCPAGSRQSSDAAVGSSITNLGCVEGEDLTQADPSVMTSDLPPVDPSNPGEPYLAPSLALGPVQQEWLDLRIHGSARRWRLPGLQCLSKSEP